MTKPTMALAELAEKGPDADLLREMIQYVAQRMMEMDVEGRCARRLRRTKPRAGEQPQRLPRPALGDARRHGRPEDPEAAIRGATSPGSSSRVGRPRRPSPR